MTGPVDASTRVYRDDTEILRNEQAAALAVDPGVHALTVRADGHAPETVRVSIAEGERKEIAVHSGATEPKAGADGGVATGSSSRAVGWALGGVGVLGLGTAAVTGLMLMNRKETVEANCGADKVCEAPGLDAASSGKTLLLVNGAAWVVGAAGLGLGAYFVLSRHSTTTLAPTVYPGFAALSCAGTF